MGVRVALVTERKDSLGVIPTTGEIWIGHGAEICFVSKTLKSRLSLYFGDFEPL